MEEPLYHVLLDGRRVGPYDRRTIVGMRIKKALASSDVVVDAGGAQLTVGELVRRPRAAEPFEPARSGSYSVVQATYAAWLAEAAGAGVTVPRFKGELEVRLQTRALRIAGRVRRGFGWKDQRLKVPLEELAHARVRGSLVDIGIRAQAGRPLQRLTLELFTPEAATEFASGLRDLPPWPQQEAAARRGALAGNAYPMVWGAVVGTALVVGAILVWVLTRRV